MNVTTWDAAGFAVLVIAHALRENMEFLLTAVKLETMLGKLSEAFPLLIVNLLERFPPRFVLNVLRALVREGFSIRDLRGVFEAMLKLNGAICHVANDEIAICPPSASLSYFEIHPAIHQDAKHYADSVRVVMKRYVTAQFAQKGDVTALEISGSTEDRLRKSRGQIRGREHESLIGAIVAASKDRHVSRPLVVLTAVDLRRRVREAIEIELPYVAVVCREEVEEEIVWRDHKYISWPGDESTMGKI
jgi:type III secretory pathway component EscV